MMSKMFIALINIIFVIIVIFGENGTLPAKLINYMKWYKCIHFLPPPPHPELVLILKAF